MRFPLSAIVLDPSSSFFLSQQRNALHMLSLDSERLTCLFTSAANLTGTFEHPTCVPYDHPQYFGHFFGHYLSALGIYLENQASSAAGAALAAKLDGLLSTVEAVQAAWAAVGQPGFFYPYSPTSFDTLEAGHNCAPVCVPYYVLHKSLAGLLDLATRLGSTRAAAAATRLGDWVVARVSHVLATGGQAQWQQVLGTEWGGMNEGMANLYTLTGNATYLATAYAFNHFVWTAPLAVRQDTLQDFHANTHLPEILGDLVGHTLTGNATQAAIVGNFLDILLSNHSWATGGSNEGEWWHAPRTLFSQLTSDTEETCTQYNIVKITSALGDVQGNASYYDWAERQFFNGLAGNQNLGGLWAGSNTTGFHYMLPLGGAGLRKPWGDSAQGFPCCWGTSTEQFAGRHLELAFAHSPSQDTLYHNLFLPVTLTWAGRGGVVVAAESGFPASTDFSTRLTFAAVPEGGAGNFTLALRVPGWTAGPPVLTLNGSPLPPSASTGPPTPGAYLLIPRLWAQGDVLSAYFPAALRWEAVVDDSPAAAHTGALLYGATLLAGLQSQSNRLPGVDTAHPEAWVSRLAGEGGQLRFVAHTSSGQCSGSGQPVPVNITLMPLGEVKDEAYTVYWSAAPETPPTGYSGSPTLAVATGEAQWSLSGGASLSGGVIRSGNPGESNTGLLSLLLQDAAHGIAGIAFDYVYNVGYGAAGRERGSNFSVALVAACRGSPQAPAILGVLYRSGDLVAPAYDACPQCYSSPVPVRVQLGTPVPVTELAQLAFIFQDNDRNLQLPVGFNVSWGRVAQGGAHALPSGQRPHSQYHSLPPHTPRHPPAQQQLTLTWTQ